MQYDHRTIEPRWQRYWDEHKTFRPSAARTPEEVHPRHVPVPLRRGPARRPPRGLHRDRHRRRYKRMRGFNVLHPMGWDAFGLPAEQHAIETGTHPARDDAAEHRELPPAAQDRSASRYDWDARDRHHRPETTSAGRSGSSSQLVFDSAASPSSSRRSSACNWCPALGTVLANEEVIDGKSERGGHPGRAPAAAAVDAPHHRLRRAAARRLEALDWPESIKAEAARLDRPQRRRRGRLPARRDAAAQAPGLHHAPRHALRRDLHGARARAPAAARAHHARARATPSKTYVDAAARKSDIERTALAKEKTGVFTGAFAINPRQRRADPDLDRRLRARCATAPARSWPCPRTTSATSSSPTQFELPIVEVVEPRRPAARRPHRTEAVHRRRRRRQLGPSRRPPHGRDASRRSSRWLEAKGMRHAARSTTSCATGSSAASATGASRFPIYFPVELDGDPRTGATRTIDYRAAPLDEASCRCSCPSSRTSSPAAIRRARSPRRPTGASFQHDGRWYARETNTMPQWAGSCWYYLRYIDPKNDAAEIFERQGDDDWMPVDLYVGGAEHAVLHLLYARFWHKVLFDLGYVPHARAVPEARQPGHDPRRRRREDVQVPRQRRQPRRRRRELRRGLRCASTRCSWARSSR